MATIMGRLINPANPANKADLGILLCRIGRAEEGLEHLRDARRIDPYFGPSWYWPALGVAQFVMRRYAEALADFDRGAPRIPHACHDGGMLREAGPCRTRSGIGGALPGHST